MRALLVCLILLLAAPIVTAQQNSTPSIITFYTDIPSVTPDQAESGTYPFSLFWETAHLRPNDQLQIQVRVLDQWYDAFPDQSLPATGSIEHIVPHTLTFDSPTLRLVILDDAGEVVSAQSLIIPYIATQESPQILAFQTSTTQLMSADLSVRRANAEVSWQVINRPVDSNLVFEQVFNDGRSISVEYPRDYLWVRSSGVGAVRPALPDGSSVRLLLRLMNVEDGSEYARTEIDIPVIQSPAQQPIVQTTVPTPESITPEIIFFTANTQNAYPGDTITLSWETRGATHVWLETITCTPRPFGGSGCGVSTINEVAASGSAPFVMYDQMNDQGIVRLILNDNTHPESSPNQLITIYEVTVP